MEVLRLACRFLDVDRRRLNAARVVVGSITKKAMKLLTARPTSNAVRAVSVFATTALAINSNRTNRQSAVRTGQKTRARWAVSSVGLSQVRSPVIVMVGSSATVTVTTEAAEPLVAYLGGKRQLARRISARRMRRLIAAAARRLDGVLIECRDWPAFIDRYDTADTLFYLDPPYWGHETDYGKDLFSREDFARLAARLQTLQGRFLLSLNDRPETRALFEAFQIETVETTYSAARGRGRRATELLISGGGTGGGVRVR